MDIKTLDTLIKQHVGTKEQLAEKLGISYMTLSRKMKDPDKLMSHCTTLCVLLKLDPNELVHILYGLLWYDLEKKRIRDLETEEQD